MASTDHRPGLLRRLERGADGFFEWIARACGWVLVVMACMITLDIVLRELRTRATNLDYALYAALAREEGW